MPEINPKSLHGGIVTGTAVKMPKRFSASATFGPAQSANPPVTMGPPRRQPVSLALLGLKVTQPKGRR